MPQKSLTEESMSNDTVTDTRQLHFLCANEFPSYSVTVQLWATLESGKKKLLAKSRKIQSEHPFEKEIYDEFVIDWDESSKLSIFVPELRLAKDVPIGRKTISVLVRIVDEKNVSVDPNSKKHIRNIKLE